MRLVVEYLNEALLFERMAAKEQNLKIRAQFERQAAALRRLAAARANRKLGQWLDRSPPLA